MNGFEFEFTAEKLHIKFKGNREAAPLAGRALHQHLGGLLGAAAGAAEQLPGTGEVVDVRPSELPKLAPARALRPSTKRNGGGGAILEFKHDPNRWGMPKQAWQIGDKVIWFLHVFREQGGAGALGAANIAATFNHHFRESGTLNPRNMKRDLRSIKARAPFALGEDANKSPSEWFLTETGKKQAAQLVTSVTGAA
jgi:hypothetical protein